MSGIASGWALEYGPADRAAKVVLVVLADCSNALGEKAFPGIATIVRRSGYSRRAVFRALKLLVDEEYVEVTAQGGGRGRSTGYRIRMERCQHGTDETVPTVPTETGNGANGDAHIRKNGRDNARPSSSCEVCEGSTWVPVPETTEFARCVCWLAVAK